MWLTTSGSTSPRHASGGRALSPNISRVSMTSPARTHRAPSVMTTSKGSSSRPQGDSRRCHPLVDEVHGQGDGDEPERGQPDLAGFRAAGSRGERKKLAELGPAVRRKGARRDRSLSEPTRWCCSMSTRSPRSKHSTGPPRYFRCDSGCPSGARTTTCAMAPPTSTPHSTPRVRSNGATGLKNSGVS